MGKVRVRFAPSPTGHLHIGGARTALFNWLFARHHGGTFLIRIEDTDTQRSTKEYLESQLASLKWMDLVSDEPLVYQLSQLDQHKKRAQELLDKGFAYPCFCQPRQAEKVVEQLEKGVGQKYDGTCRDKVWTQDDLQKPYALRFKLDKASEQLEFDDAIRGKISVNSDQLDDFVIIRQGGIPTYNFCVVVDDHDMDITHVIRGEDHISNTFKQMLLYRALGLNCPVFAHLPLILGESGNKLSKRDAAVSVELYRENGYLFEALFNYLVRLGWSHGDQEVFTRDQLVQLFDLDSVGKKGAIFDIAKLDWLNGTYIRSVSHQRLLESIAMMDKQTLDTLKKFWSEGELEKIFELYKKRATTLRTLVDGIIALADDPKDYDLSLIAKWRSDNTPKMLHDFISILEKTDKVEHKALMEKAKVVCEKYGEKLVALAQPLRLALTGTIQSPGVFGLIEVLGGTKVVKRITRLIEAL